MEGLEGGVKLLWAAEKDGQTRPLSGNQWVCTCKLLILLISSAGTPVVDAQRTHITVLRLKTDRVIALERRAPVPVEGAEGGAHGFRSRDGDWA